MDKERERGGGREGGRGESERETERELGEAEIGRIGFKIWRISEHDFFHINELKWSIIIIIIIVDLA